MASRKNTSRVAAPRSAATKKPRARATKSAPGKSKPGKKVRLTVRHYCQGIGDCHLLRFRKDDGTDFNMLIDCGVHSSVAGGSQMVRAIAQDIKSLTDTIDVMVVTHEHMDHISGFLTANDIFQQIDFGEIWMGWTENAKDKQARALDKYKEKALAALQASSRHLDRAMGLSPHLQGIQTGLQGLTGFYFGAAGDRVRSARDAAVALANKHVRYLEPTSAPLSIPGLSDLRIYVLGPPRDEAMIRVTDRTSEMYGLSMSRGLSMSASLASAVANHDGLSDQAEDDVLDPFDKNLGTPLCDVLSATEMDNLPDGTDSERQFKKLCAFIEKHYSGKATSESEARHCPDQSWRRIDMDWLGISADLAMQLDNRTNNTSVVLAFEFIKSGRVFLFTADAQVGSWLSWQELSWKIDKNVVTGPDLLKRTVYYKVGHHGSRNATLEAKGLDLMNDPDFAAFVPTNENDAKNVHWGQMPYKGIMKALKARTTERIVCADDRWIRSGKIPDDLTKSSGAILKVRVVPKLCVEFDLA